MASPITSEDFVVDSSAGDLCERITRLLGAMEQIRLLLDYMFEPGTGEFTQAMRSIGLPPPGLVCAYWTTTTDFATAKAEVERLQRTEVDIEENNGPLWRICDGTNGTPDLRCRFIVGAGPANESDGLTLKTVNDKGGAESVALSGAQIGDHDHLSGCYNTATAPIGDNDMVFPSATETTLDSPVTVRHLHTDSSGPGAPLADFEKMNIKTLGVLSSGDARETHNNMPPYHCLYWIIRTSRIF